MVCIVSYNILSMEDGRLLESRLATRAISKPNQTLAFKLQLTWLYDEKSYNVDLG